MARQVKAAGEAARADLSAEIDRLAVKGLPGSNASGWPRLIALFPSAEVLLSELQVRLFLIGLNLTL